MGQAITLEALAEAVEEDSVDRLEEEDRLEEDRLEEDRLAAEAAGLSEVQAAGYLAVTCRPPGNNCFCRREICSTE